MKFRRIYVIDGIPVDEFYEKNATDLDFYLNGDYELMNSEFGIKAYLLLNSALSKKIKSSLTVS